MRVEKPVQDAVRRTDRQGDRSPFTGDREPSTARISVVIPIFNEEEIIPELGRRLRAVADQSTDPWEIILVNDGSTDGSLAALRDLVAEDPRFKIIDFSRNFGHQPALYSGLRRATGDCVILMDGDLQDPPEVLPRMIEEWKGGAEVVYMIRRKRKEGLLKRMAYKVYYQVLHRLAYMPVPTDAGDFSLMDRRVVDLIRGMPERGKFLRGLRAWAGFRQVGLEYERDARYAGVTKYSLPKLMRLALDGLVAYSFAPLRFAYVAGFAISVGSFLLAGYYALDRIFSADPIAEGFTTLVVVVLFLGGGAAALRGGPGGVSRPHL